MLPKTIPTVNIVTNNDDSNGQIFKVTIRQEDHIHTYHMCTAIVKLSIKTKLDK